MAAFASACTETIRKGRDKGGEREGEREEGQGACRGGEEGREGRRVCGQGREEGGVGREGGEEGRKGERTDGGRGKEGWRKSIGVAGTDGIQGRGRLCWGRRKKRNRDRRALWKAFYPAL